MSDLEQEPPRPSPLSSAPGAAPAPRLLGRPLPTTPGGEPPASTPRPELPPGTAAPARTTARADRPGEIVLPRIRLSLQRLYRLEQELSQIPGAGQASIDILDDGQIVVHISPGAEERVRQYLALIETAP